MNFFKPKFWDKNQISFFSLLLFPVSLLIKVLSHIKRFLTKTNQSSIPIICVGNIYLGGTGKTPLCIEIFSILKNLNMNPVFIRKKYTSFQDEVNLQKQVGPIYQNKKSRYHQARPRIDQNGRLVRDCLKIISLEEFLNFSGCRTMVVRELPKLETWVRFPSPAPPQFKPLKTVLFWFFLFEEERTYYRNLQHFHCSLGWSGWECFRSILPVLINKNGNVNWRGEDHRASALAGRTTGLAVRCSRHGPE